MSILKTIAQWVVGKTDKSQYFYPSLVPRKSDPKTTTSPEDIANVTFVHGQQFETAADGSSVRKGYNETDKNLTGAEINDMLAQGIDLRKAAIVKSAKATGDKTQKMVSEMLNTEHGKGFSVSSISPIWSILEAHAARRRGGAASPLPNGEGPAATKTQLEANGTDNQ